MNKLLFGLITATILMLSPFLLLSDTHGQSEENEDSRIEGYDIYKEKMLPKCLEFKEAGTLDLLKNEEPELWLMCLEFIIDEDTTNKSKE